MMPNQHPQDAVDREAATAAIVLGYERLMQLLSLSQGTPFVDASLTMSQAKVLFLIHAEGQLHMSEVAARLGVTLSTVSGLVDRLVDQGLVSRRDDPADRRQVVLAVTAGGSDIIDRFRQLNVRQFRDLLGALDDSELELVRRSLEVLTRAAGAIAGAASETSLPPLAMTGKDA